MTAKNPIHDKALVKDAREALKVLVRPLDRLRKNPRRVLASPQTFLERLALDMRASVVEDAQQRDALESLLVRALASFPDSEEDVLRTLRERLEHDRETLHRDEIGAHFLRLYDLANRSGPVTPIKVLFGGIDDEGPVVLGVLGKLDEAGRLRGERRVRALLEAMPDLLEVLYKRYLFAIWSLSFLSAGDWPSQPPDHFGSFVIQVANRVRDFPGLVDLDAAHFRNAVAHRHFEYLPSKRSVEFWEDKNRWKTTLNTETLEERIGALWHVSITLTNKLQSIAVKEFNLRAGMFSHLLRMRDAARANPSSLGLPDSECDASMAAEVMRSTPPPGVRPWFPPKKMVHQ